MWLLLPLLCHTTMLIKLFDMHLGHLGEIDMEKVGKRGILDRRDVKKSRQFYEQCVFSKQKRVKFTRTSIGQWKHLIVYILSL